MNYDNWYKQRFPKGRSNYNFPAFEDVIMSYSVACFRMEDQLINSGMTTYKKFEEELFDNKEAMLFAVGLNGMFLEHVSARIQNDKEVVLEVVAQNGWAIEFASDELLRDEDVLYETATYWVDYCTKMEGSFVEYVPDYFKMYVKENINVEQR